MWEQYRKHLIPTQIFIILICALLVYSNRATVPAAVLFMVAMEIGALIGAWWGARLKGKLEDRGKRLPLDR